MCGTSSVWRAPKAAMRCALVLLGLCLLFSATPCVDIDMAVTCDFCDQDELIAGPAARFPEEHALLLEQPKRPRVSAPAPLAYRFPHPLIL